MGTGPVIPTVYFDNCLVGALVKGEFPAEMPALGSLMGEHIAGRISLCASTEVLGEIQKLPAEYQGPHLDLYQQLKHLPAANVTWIDQPNIRSTDLDYQKARDILPGETDRRHVVHAAKNGIQHFATVDEHTILNRRDSLEASFAMKFGTPTEIARALHLPTT